jgi:hypothetical protein
VCCIDCLLSKHESIDQLQLSCLLHRVGQGGENSTPFACTVLTRDSGNTFGSSATAGGLLFYSCILFSVYPFFFGVSENFSPGRDF